MRKKAYREVVENLSQALTETRNQLAQTQAQLAQALLLNDSLTQQLGQTKPIVAPPYTGTGVPLR